MDIDFEFAKKLKEKVLKIYEESKNIKDIAIKNKEKNDIVTAVDVFMENEIIKIIKEWFPEQMVY